MEVGSLAEWVLAISAVIPSPLALLQARHNSSKLTESHAIVTRMVSESQDQTAQVAAAVYQVQEQTTQVAAAVDQVQAQTNGMDERLEEVARQQGHDAGVAETEAKQNGG